MKHLILFHRHPHEMNGDFSFELPSWLGKEEIDKNLKYHRFIDRYNHLAGKLLLKLSMQQIGLQSELMHDILVTEQKRPYLPVPYDFNITHCDDAIAIAIAENRNIGLDIEDLCPLTIQDFHHCFTTCEWNDIITSKNQYERFLYYWTRKEAVLKAIGSGLLIHPSTFEAIRNMVLMDDKTLYIYPITIDKRHICHLATEDSNPEISIHEEKNLFDSL